jgi:hypothetical protein
MSGHRRGVWEADAPTGHVALVVYDSTDRRVLRLEVAADVYSPEWVTALEQWLATSSAPALQIVR